MGWRSVRLRTVDVEALGARHALVLRESSTSGGVIPVRYDVLSR